jgi:glycosyltransferase involved in cell wall biosynthesis
MMPKQIERDLASIQAYLYLMGSDIDPLDLRNFAKISAKFRSLAASKDAPKIVPAWTSRTVERLQQMGSQIGFPLARIAPFGLPRHDTLFAKANAEPGDRKVIVVFLTWRDYWMQSGSEEQLRSQPFYNVVREIVDDARVIEFLEAHDLRIAIYVHQKMSAYRSVLSDNLHPRVSLIDDKVNLQEMIVQSAALITDYSSVSLDFCLIGRPIFFYQFDRERYNEGRGTYTDEQSEWVGDIIEDAESLVQAIRSLFDPTLIARAKSYSDALCSDYPSLGRSCEAIASAIDTLPPRVTFICYNIFGIGGTVRSVTNCANYLFEKGYHVEVLSLRKTSAIPDLGLHPSIRVTSLLDMTNRNKSFKRYLEKLLTRVPSVSFDRNEDQYGNVSLLTDLRLIWYLKNCTADVVIPTIPSLARTTIKHSRKRTRVLVQEHKFFAAHPPSICRMIEKTYRGADGIVTATKDDAAKYGEISNVPTYVVPNGVQLRPAVEFKGSEIRRVVALGRLEQQKQFSLLIAAFAKVADEFPEWRLFIYGTGAERENLRNQIGGLQLSRKVFLKGPTKDSGAVIDRADICAVSSTYEGFGMVYIEAYASGKPVVSFDIEKGPKEIMIDGETGLKAKPFDVDDYAAKLATLMASEQLRKTMGENGRRFLMQTYEISKVGLELEKAIIATAGQQASRAQGGETPERNSAVSSAQAAGA